MVIPCKTQKTEKLLRVTTKVNDKIKSHHCNEHPVCTSNNKKKYTQPTLVQDNPMWMLKILTGNSFFKHIKANIKKVSQKKNQ